LQRPDAQILQSAIEGNRPAAQHHRDGAERERRVDGGDLDDALRQPASTVNVRQLRSRAILDSTIRPGSSSGGDDGRPVLLTGATGFLGAFVLRELLARGQKVVCLVRSNDSDAAEARLQGAADRLGIIWPVPDSVAALSGDTSKPRLGLSQKEFESLAASVGGIYHCAAPVSWVKSYAALEPAVVGGAREMLRLAVLNGGKPLHYVSSLAVFPFDGTARPEDHHSLDHGMSLLGGYAQAKWVGERLMAEGARRGLPVTIYRPPLISGHSRTGVFNADSYFERMIKGCIELGEAPQLDGVVDVAPVDYVAAALIDIATQRSSAGQVYHLNNPHPMAFSAFVDWIRGRGYPLVSVPFARWQQHLLSRNAFGDNALDPLTAHLKHASSGTMTTAVHDCRNAMAALSPSGLRCPALGAELLSVYFEAFENSGYLGPLVEIGSPRRLA
ncbi:hypothetical protein A5787_23555, partial [Mycobacterium sp. 852002-50816_SCH5313054-b]|uniref:thioester reductase domain-containing protein n=1 Tax=Mycobacterium sp. 852002-50816_SCH5313054-b TaxID=1834092 RepID=UPI0008011689